MAHSIASNSKRVYREDTLYTYERSIERAIHMMHERLGNSITIDEIADAAFMSRYHFIRVFSKVTGVSPGRFLAAIRIQEAKRLLLQSDYSVTDISLTVGYNSLGTFTRIFVDFVGFSPIRFRQLSRPLLHIHIEEIAQMLPLSQRLSKKTYCCGEVVCTSQPALIAIAVFPIAIPRSHPLECTYLTKSLRFSLNQKPPSGSLIFAVGLLPKATIEDALLVSQNYVLCGAIHSSNIMTNEALALKLRPKKPVDPPVVAAFPLHIVESLAAVNVI